jgi:hypothetical protein
MDNKEIFVFTAALVLAAALLYRKYFKKDKGKNGPDSKGPSGSMSSPSAENEEYEPYSKKKGK